MNDDVLNEIAQYDEAYDVPERAAILPGVEALADGTYVFDVVSAELGRTKNTEEAILKLTLRVVGGASGGLTVERPYFFRRQESVDNLGADLRQMGFDSHLWTGANRRPFSAELAAALPRVPGIRFQATKKTVAGEGLNGKPNHNLYINSLIKGPAAAGGAAPQGQPAAQQPAARPAAGALPGASFRPGNKLPF